MLIKLVNVRLHIGKAALDRANTEDGEDFMQYAKHAVMILESAYDVLTNHLPASWMCIDGAGDAGINCTDSHPRMDHDANIECDKAPDRRQHETDSRGHEKNDAMHIEVRNPCMHLQTFTFH